MAETKNFRFPKRGFFLVADKVAEADFFLDKIIESNILVTSEFNYHFSAFVSATRSITFALQAVMTDVPEFESWYKIRQERLKKSELASYFVNLRNYMQKVGGIPIDKKGTFSSGFFEDQSEFVPILDLKSPPQGKVSDCCKDYLRLVLSVIAECYHDFWLHCDPRALFTQDGLFKMGWSIEDLEEALGCPRGWTDIPWDAATKVQERLIMMNS